MEARILGNLGRAAARRLERGSLSTPPGIPGRPQRHRGYTLVEVILAVTIFGILVALALAAFQGYRDRVKVSQAAADLVVLAVSIGEFKGDNKRFPTNLAEIGKDTMLDPWGNAYQYIDHTDGSSSGRWRKDKNIHPINTDFDLYSKGKDGNSVAPLTANPSRDDIIRANDGAFVGLVSAYDP